ncbi:hypothetical protein H2200_008808 [Cladophialophora chaetospira]|uniref:HMG box domain-containing protein n=1 Tax=Cladophialophora chaetospira TaxID=386627 RepID=A0AA38X4S8_9EURO|nr:hypothetical protein H2200_008808 [Cladophialophora chaetospira]
MTVAAPISRSLALQLLARSARSLTRPVSVNPLLRVNCDCGTEHDQSNYRAKYANLRSLFKQARTYATAAGKPASRPKQHTGRTTTKRTTKPTTKAIPAKKPAAKKPKKKVAKKAPRKAKPRTKKEPSKTALLKKARKEQSDLKAAALLEEPKNLPSNPFQIILVEQVKGTKGNATLGATAASNKYKNLSLEERERYNHEANQNKAKNEQAYKRWVQSHTPAEIKTANNARRLLTKKAKAAGKKTTYRAIKDDRHVHQPMTSYTYFSKARNDSGDLNGMSISERGKLVGQEWKALTAAEKKTFDDQAKADKNRYLEEHKTVYGIDSPSTKKKAQ